MRFDKTVCPSGLRGWTQVPLARAAWVQIPQLSFIAKAILFSYLSPQGRLRAFPLCPKNKRVCHCIMRGICRNNGYMKYCGSVLSQFVCLSQSLVCLALHAMKSKSASAGNRTRVTSMATMYSATRPLMPDISVLSMSDLQN